MTDTDFDTSVPNSRLFVLGAGFSKPAGLPLGVELLEEVRRRVRRYHQAYDWDGPLEKEIEEWSELYPHEELTLESVFAYSHRKHFLQLIGSDEYFSHGSRSIVSARHAIQAILTEATPADPSNLYTDFATKLTANDTVLTFNYDTLMEQTLEALGKPFSLTPEWWLKDEDQDGATRDYRAKYIDLLKLHGSIDWYDREYYLETRKYHSDSAIEVPDEDPLFGPNRSIPTESLAAGRVDPAHTHDILARVVRVPNHPQYFPITPKHYTVVPFLLPPAYDKLLGHDPIRSVWRDMHRSFQTNSSIVVIGYSMPRYDEYAYEALGRLIVEFQDGGDRTYFGHRRVPLQIITLAASEDEVFESTPFLSRAQTRVWTSGFTEEALDWIDWGD